MSGGDRHEGGEDEKLKEEEKEQECSDEAVRKKVRSHTPQGQTQLWKYMVF